MNIVLNKDKYFLGLKTFTYDIVIKNDGFYDVYVYGEMIRIDIYSNNTYIINLKYLSKFKLSDLFIKDFNNLKNYGDYSFVITNIKYLFLVEL